VKRKARISIVIAISILLNICLTGCWNSREINSLAFMTSMGFDKSEKGIKLTIQVFNPRAIASSRAVNEPSVIVFTDEGKDTIEMIRRTITQSSRKLNGTHLQTVIFGEEFAKDGISEVLDFLSREHQFRTHIYFLVAKGISANEVLTTLTDMDPIPSTKLFNALKAADQVWAGTKTVETIDLVNSIIADGDNPVLSGVELNGQHEDNDSIDELKEAESDPLRIKGLAVFERDKFVGWLDENESKGYKYIIGDVPGSMAYVESQETGKITLEVIGTKSKYTATMENGKPSIIVDIEVKTNIETVSNGFDITKEENIKKIEKMGEEKLKTNAKKSIYKAQKVLVSDIFGFGEQVHRTFPKEWPKMKDDWNSRFKDLPIKINTKVTIEKTGPISKSFFTKDS